MLFDLSVTMTCENFTPASLQPTMKVLPALPNEIFLLIIQRCPGAILKQLRLVSKSLAQMAEPFLWRKVILVPNDHCILGFIKALKRSKVLRHVTKLSYDGRFGSFWSRIKEVPQTLNLPYPAADRAKDLVSLDRTHQGHFKPHEDVSIEVACLAKALRLLTNLKQVCVLEYEDETSSNITLSSPNTSDLKVPSFYLKISKKLRVDPSNVSWTAMAGGGRSYAKGILTAAFSADCRLQKFKAKSISGHNLFGAMPMKSPAAFQQLSIFKNIMDGLRELELSFRNDTLLNNHIEAVGQLLKAAKRLKKLKLRLTDCSANRCHYSDDELMSDFGALVETSTGTWLCKPLMPKLETLIIDACICHDEDLMHFLKLHAGSLRRLALSNITLLGGEDRRECWVRMIKHLRTELKLASISFSGWFSNGGRQQWSVTKEIIGTERLKAKVENYVVDRRIRDCPLEPVAIKVNEGDVVKPADGEEFEGDLTWTMVYSSQYADHVDWQPTEPSFGINSNVVSSHSSEVGSPTPPPHSDTDSWEDVGFGYGYVDAHVGSATNGPVFENSDCGGGFTHPFAIEVSSAPKKIQQAAPSLAPSTWDWNPVAPSFMA